MNLMLVQCKTNDAIDELTERMYSQALTEAIREFGQGHPEVATAATNLADLYMFFGSFEPAEELYRMAFEIYGHIYQSDDLRYTIAIRNLADALACMGKQKESDELRKGICSILG